MFLIRGQESCSFLFPVLGSLGASRLTRGGNRQCRVYVVGGDRMSATGCIEARQAGRQAGQGAQAEVSGSAAEIVAAPSAGHSPTFLAGGGLLEWWEAAGISLQLALEASNFKAASVVVKLRRESVPQFSRLVSPASPCQPGCP